MAIRERFRRVLRKSDSSDTISQTESNTTTASSTRQSSSSEASSPQLLKSTSTTTSSSTLSRKFTFGRRDKDKDKEKANERLKEKDRKKGSKTWRHPSEKPLTAQNLKHQEILNQFTMTFGTRNLSQIQDVDFDGVSPCCTRPCSIDGGSR